MAIKPIIILLVSLTLASVHLAEAQQAKKIVQIGYLSPRSRPTALVAFKEGLRELGWVEGKQVKFEYRYAGDQLDKLTNFATELVRLRVDVIVAGPGNGAAIAAKRATTTIPIVMVMVVDPVRASPDREQMLPASPSMLHRSRPGKTWSFLRKPCLRFRAWRSLETLTCEPIWSTARRLREQPRCSELRSSLQRCKR
jgi:ABC transporter substrate binding protein